MQGSLSLGVECAVEGRELVPRWFTIGGRRIEVREVVDRWLAPQSSYFKVRAADGAIYILRHDTERSSWELMVYDSGARAETRLSST